MRASVPRHQGLSRRLRLLAAPAAAVLGLALASGPGPARAVLDVPPAPGASDRDGEAAPARRPAAAVPASLAVDLSDGEAAIAGELLARGRFLYGLYCADCHGPGGRGDGPRADQLETPPADLTRMSERAGGTFPFLAAYGVIDGRYGPASHEVDDMPAWGLVFQELDKDTDQADEVRGRILQLLHYLRSIQEPDGTTAEP